MGSQDPGSRGRNLKVRKVEKKSSIFSKISSSNNMFFENYGRIDTKFIKSIQRAPIFGLILLIYVSRYPAFVRKVCILPIWIPEG